jgi:hypothetical protein
MLFAKTHVIFFCTLIRQILVTFHAVCKNPRYVFMYTSRCLQKPTLCFYVYFTLFAKTHVMFLHFMLFAKTHVMFLCILHAVCKNPRYVFTFHAVCKNPRYVFMYTSDCLQKPTLCFYVYFTLFAKTHVIFLYAHLTNPRYFSPCLQKPTLSFVCKNQRYLSARSLDQSSLFFSMLHQTFFYGFWKYNCVSKITNLNVYSSSSSSSPRANALLFRQTYGIEAILTPP